jgi:vitamin B12 transporter
MPKPRDRARYGGHRHPRRATGISQPGLDLDHRPRADRTQPGPDLLRAAALEAGVDVARTGGPGGQTSVFMRGSNSNHVLVLIDGIRVAAAGTGAFAWENLDLAVIERIEIVRGPRGALRLGCDRRRDPDLYPPGRRHELRAGYGRYRDRSLSAASATRGRSDRRGRRVGGFSAQNERGFAFDPDDDGFETVQPGRPRQ